MKHIEIAGFELDDVPRETTRRLQLLVDVVQRWNKTINLVAVANEETLWKRHILDSLQAAKFLPKDAQSAADLGSGGGFPGLVLAIASGVIFDLIEADKRKAAFLVHAAQITSAAVRVHACRIEEAALSNIDVVTSRALAPLSRLLEYAAPMLAPCGTCLFLKGANVSAELAVVSVKWNMRVKRTASRLRAGSELLCIDRISRV